MNLKSRDLRALVLLLAAVTAIVLYRSFGSPSARVVAGGDSTDLLERRLAKLRRAAALVPGKASSLKNVQADLQNREKFVLASTTAPLAQAHLLDIVHRVAAANKIEPRGGDFSPPTPFGADYGQVAVSISFECRIEDFVNFLADLSKEPELIAPSEIHVNVGNAKNKTITVRMTLAGVVSKKLAPEKRTIGAL